MAKLEQEGRPIGVETPLGKDKLVLTGFEGEERLSGLFNFTLKMMSEDDAIDPKKIVGERVDFFVRHQDGEERWFNGLVNGFSYKGGDDRVHHYTANVVPWMWLLTRGSDCRVHESSGGKDVKDIVDIVLQDLGLTDYEWDVNRGLEKRTYCLQYDETHFNFVSRLLAEEGIFYYFKHEKGKHTLVLSDHTNGAYDLKDDEVNLASNLSQPELTDNLSSWSHEYEYVAGKYALTDYDFEQPTSSLLKNASSLVSLKDNSKFEFYEYPGDYVSPGLGDALVKMRIEEEEVSHDMVTGSSECRTFSPGGRFTMNSHHNSAEEGRKWVLTAVGHHAELGGNYFSSSDHSDQIYQNTFRCIPDTVVFRPPREHHKPRVMGMLPATVVGPSGEEIHTDEHARIKVQFPWDRVGKHDENSCCWVRVATPWAGAAWGMVHIPRIGQEVIVSFLNGDADQPVVMGSLYNGDNEPPFSLPDNKTQSGLKSCSTPGGSASSDFNELRFEDKKGEEEIYIHAEKDLNCVIENNETRKVGHDDMDAGDQEIDIYNDQNLIVGKGSGGGSQTVDIQKDRSVTLEQGNDSLILKQGDMSVELKMGSQTTKLKMGDQKTTLDMGSQTTKMSLGSSKTEAMQKIELKVGGSSITIDQMGVTIKGMMIKVEGTAMADVKAPMATVSGDAMLTLKGGLTMIN
jgi:type VI secretion system secreted protein VgrG